MYLDNDSVVKAIGMGSIIVKAILKAKIHRFFIKYAFHMPKLQASFLLVDKFVSNN